MHHVVKKVSDLVAPISLYHIVTKSISLHQVVKKSAYIIAPPPSKVRDLVASRSKESQRSSGTGIVAPQVNNFDIVASSSKKVSDLVAPPRGKVSDIVAPRSKKVSDLVAPISLHHIVTKSILLHQVV